MLSDQLLRFDACRVPHREKLFVFEKTRVNDNTFKAPLVVFFFKSELWKLDLQIDTGLEK